MNKFINSLSGSIDNVVEPTGIIRVAVVVVRQAEPIYYNGKFTVSGFHHRRQSQIGLIYVRDDPGMRSKPKHQSRAGRVDDGIEQGVRSSVRQLVQVGDHVITLLRGQPCAGKQYYIFTDAHVG